MLGNPFSQYLGENQIFCLGPQRNKRPDRNVQGMNFLGGFLPFLVLVEIWVE